MEQIRTRLTPMVVCYFLKDGNVLLGLRKKTSWDMGRNLLSGIGGKVGDLPGLENEKLEEAVAREVMEEIGVTVKIHHKQGEVTVLFPDKPKWDQFIHVYIIDEWEGEPIETESIRPEWHPIDAIPVDRMWDDSKHYLPQLFSGQYVRATFVYGPDNRTVKSKKVKIDTQ